MSARPALAFAAAFLGAALLDGCGPLLPGGPTPPVAEMLQQVIDAPENVAHSGTRRVTSRWEQDGVWREVRFLEEVKSDGQGHFAINVEGKNIEDSALAAARDIVAFEYQRQGFNFKFRDLRIRDLDLVATNYAISILGYQIDYIGRPCWEMAVARQPIGQGRTYALTADLETGLLLKYVEYDAAWNVLSSVEYLSIDFAPSFEGVAWYQPKAMPAVDLDAPATTHLAELGFVPWVPKLLPEGYRLVDAVRIDDETEGTWVRLTYTDGVETAFFLHGGIIVEDVTLQGAGGSGAGGAGLMVQGPGASLNDGEGASVDEVIWSRAGAVVVAQGLLRNQRLIAIGKVSEFDLLRMLDSSLP